MAKQYKRLYSESLKEKSLLIRVKRNSNVIDEVKFLSKVYPKTRQYPLPAIVMRPLSLISTM